MATQATKRAEARSLLEILDTTRRWSDDLLATVANDESLRDLTSHKQSLGERLQTWFSAFYLSQTKAILFDCEIRLSGQGVLPIALLNTAHESSQFVSFTVLNFVAVMLGEQQLPLEAYAPQWQCCAVARSKFLISEPDNAPLGAQTLTVVKRSFPGGFDVEHKNYRRELWDTALEWEALRDYGTVATKVE
jgi:hypothetical protein